MKFSSGLDDGSRGSPGCLFVDAGPGGGQAPGPAFPARRTVIRIFRDLAGHEHGELRHPGPSAQKGVPAGQGVVEGNEIPYTPAGLAKKMENSKKRATDDPESKCYLPGVPRLTYMPFPFQILQTPGQVTILYEYVHAIRYIYTNGTPHPPGPELNVVGRLARAVGRRYARR